MTVKQFLAGPIGTNCYLLINEKTKEAVIVDPASCPDYMMNYIKTEEIKLKAVLLTHAHFDHIMGIDDVLNKYGKMPVYVHEADKPMLEDPQQNTDDVLWLSLCLQRGTGSTGWSGVVTDRL